MDRAIPLNDMRNYIYNEFDTDSWCERVRNIPDDKIEKIYYSILFCRDRVRKQREDMIKEEREKTIAILEGLFDSITLSRGDGKSTGKNDIKLALMTAISAVRATEQTETVTEFADRCRECGARYGKLLKQMTEWTPVSERLPDVNVDVLLTCYDGERQFVGWLDAHGKWQSEDEEGVIQIVDGYEPIAWMPLPKPYKVRRK